MYQKRGRISIIVYTGKLMRVTNKTKQNNLLTLVSTFNMVAEYKINIEKSIVFLYLAKKLENKIKTFIIAAKYQIPRN